MIKVILIDCYKGNAKAPADILAFSLKFSRTPNGP